MSSRTRLPHSRVELLRSYPPPPPRIASLFIFFLLSLLLRFFHLILILRLLFLLFLLPLLMLLPLHPQSNRVTLAITYTHLERSSPYSQTRFPLRNFSIFRLCPLLHRFDHLVRTRVTSLQPCYTSYDQFDTENTQFCCR